MSSPNSDPSDARTRLFVLLLGQHELSLRTFVLAMAPHLDEAEEIIQKTRIRLWEQFDQYDPAKDFGAWARTIAYYLTLAERKTSRRLPALQQPEFFEAIAEDYPSEQIDNSRRQIALTRCLGKLDEVRRTLVMRYYSGRETMAEIAEKLRLTEAAVKLRIVRSRMTLAACIEKSLQEDDQ
ncbi:MAG: sigma-70 family RNA polymerase sigma factor [Planctomycetes bacterium]|nr:sigma-70 family RNA polymerase sigma factor [Planctomycetota bacterium]